jgi:hypothetical protein
MHLNFDFSAVQILWTLTFAGLLVLLVVLLGRDREQKTTALYAKVDRTALGGLVRPWPSRGGVA